MTTGPSSIHRSPILDGSLLKRLSNATARRRPPVDLTNAAANAKLTAAKQTLPLRPGAHRPALRPLYTDQPYLKDQLLGASNPAPVGQPTLADDPAIKGETAPSLTPEELLQGIKDNWGQANPQYDLNQDGLVGIADLLQLLSNWPTDTAETPTDSPEPPAIDSAEPSPKTDTPATLAPEEEVETDTRVLVAEQDPRLRSPEELLKGIRTEWGNANAEFDLTGDGIVGIADLLELLNNWTSYQDMYLGGTSPYRGAAEGQVPTDTPSLTTAGATSKQPQRPLEARQAALEHITKLFETARSGETDPAELRTAVADLKLPANLEQALLTRLSKFFPPGRQLNLIG